MQASALESYLSQALSAPGPEPIYQRLHDALVQALGQGVLKPGSKLPSERTLSEHLGVSRVTLRKAIDALCASGTLIRHQGAKTVVAPRLEKSVSKLSSFSEDMRSRGHEPGAYWLSKSLTRPSPREALMLGLGRDAFVVRLERVRLADGEPVAIERATVPQSVLPDIESVDQSLYAALERRGARPVRGTQRLHASAATSQDAKTLNCAVGAPLLCIERTCFSANDTCVEFTETRYLGSAYDFLTDLVE